MAGAHVFYPTTTPERCPAARLREWIRRGRYAVAAARPETFTELGLWISPFRGFAASRLSFHDAHAAVLGN
ncbi:MAG: hypothetical protein QOH52_1139, partial [Pseudonocardiales bacterium]|nr:hypothetical protein [Pseudonocardiales bacterium]